MAKVYNEILNALKKLRGQTVDVPELATKLNMDSSYIYKVIKENPQLKIKTTAPTFNYSKAELKKGAKYYKYPSFEKAPQNKKMLIKYFIRQGKGKFKVPDLSTQFTPKFFKDYTDEDFIKDLKNKKDPYTIAKEYYEKNKAFVKKELTGNVEYTRPIGYLNKILKNKRRSNPEVAKELQRYRDWSDQQKPPRTLKEYTKKVEELIPLAKERNIIPENINTSEQYFRFVKKQRIDPLMRLFNNLEKIGIEHIGGIARAVDLTDANTLQEVVPILGGEKVNKAKGLKYDRPMTGLVQNIIRSDIPEAQEKSLKALNLMGKRAGKEFGVPVSAYELTDEGLKRVSSGRTLQDPLFEDAKALIKKQIVPQGGSKRELFKNYPVYTQNAIKAVEAGDNALFIKNLKAGLLEAVEASPTSCKAFLNKAIGGPSLNCIDTINKDPIKAAQQLADTKTTSGAVGQVKNVAQSFLNILKSPGVKSFTAAGVVGGVGSALVKEFRNDDPSTYLSDEDQQKSLLVEMATDPITTEMPRPDILDYQLPLAGALVAGSTIATAPKTIKASKSRALGVEQKRPGVVKTGFRTLGRGLGVAASPGLLAPLAAMDIAGQISEGDSVADIATNPLNYLYPAFSESTPKFTRGLPSVVRKAASLGLGKLGLRLLSRAGIVGLGLSLGIQGYNLLNE